MTISLTSPPFCSFPLDVLFLTSAYSSLSFAPFHDPPPFCSPILFTFPPFSLWYPHAFLLSPPNLYFCSLFLSQSLKSFPSLIMFLSLLISKVLPLISLFFFHLPIHSFHPMFSSSLSDCFSFLLCFPFPLILFSIVSSFLCL